MCHTLFYYKHWEAITEQRQDNVELKEVIVQLIKTGKNQKIQKSSNYMLFRFIKVLWRFPQKLKQG